MKIKATANVSLQKLIVATQSSQVQVKGYEGYEAQQHPGQEPGADKPENVPEPERHCKIPEVSLGFINLNTKISGLYSVQFCRKKVERVTGL